MCITPTDPFPRVAAKRFIRKMHGGTQAHLLEANDGNFYVVKFSNNPQGCRVLVNDAIGTFLLRRLGISTPDPVLINVTREFLLQNPEVSMQFGARRVAVNPGLHFGSRYPMFPDRRSVFDLLPDLLLPSVENLAHFCGALVFDKWTGNTDCRQAVFYRLSCDFIGSPGKTDSAEFGPLHALMVDQGMIMNGRYWDFKAGPLHGLYHNEHVYAALRSFSDCEPWLELVEHFPESALVDLVRCIPAQWIEGSEAQLERIVSHLVRRRKRVAAMIHDSCIAKPSCFPNWDLKPT